MPRGRRRKVINKVDQQIQNVKELIDEAPIRAKITKREQELSDHYARGRRDGIMQAREEASKMIADLREALREQQENAQRTMGTATNFVSSIFTLLGKGGR